MPSVEELFGVEVSEDTLAPPAFEQIRTGSYRATLKGDVYLTEPTENEWQAIIVTYENLSGNAKQTEGKEYPGREVQQRITVAARNGDAVRIGYEQMVALAAALGLAEHTETGYKLLTNSKEEFVDQLNSMAGKELQVWVKTGPRMRKNKNTGVKEIQLRDDGEPWIDSEVTSARALK